MTQGGRVLAGHAVCMGAACFVVGRAGGRGVQSGLLLSLGRMQAVCFMHEHAVPDNCLHLIFKQGMHRVFRRLFFWVVCCISLQCNQEQGLHAMQHVHIACLCPGQGAVVYKVQWRDERSRLCCLHGLPGRHVHIRSVWDAH